MVNIPSTEGGGISPADPSSDRLIVPVLEETAVLTKDVVTTGRVRVVTHSQSVEEIAHASLRSETVDVTRVPVNQPVSGDLPQIRTEGDVTIIPVLEEVMVVETRLMLKEELHIRRRTTAEEFEVPVTLRRQSATVERDDATHIDQP